MKGQPCADCGLHDPPAMTFDHVPGRGEKLFNIGDSVQNKSYGRFVAELAKCDVVCRPCHEERTYVREQRGV